MALVRLSTRVDGETSDFIKELAELQDGSESAQARLFIELGQTRFDELRTDIRRQVSSHKGVNSIVGICSRLKLQRNRRWHDLSFRAVRSAVARMVADGELYRIDEGLVEKTDKMPKTRHRVTRGRQTR